VELSRGRAGNNKSKTEKMGTNVLSTSGTRPDSKIKAPRWVTKIKASQPSVKSRKVSRKVNNKTENKTRTRAVLTNSAKSNFQAKAIRQLSLAEVGFRSQNSSNISTEHKTAELIKVDYSSSWVSTCP